MRKNSTQMNKFPFYSHFAIKMIFDDIAVDQSLIEIMSKTIVNGLNLNIVKECEYEFPNQGYTRVYVLSKSHLVFHTWPENHAVHVDLMTCDENVNKGRIQSTFSVIQTQETEIRELIY